MSAVQPGYKMTEVGVIPEDWGVEYLDNLVSLPIQNGFSPTCPDAPTGLWTLSLSALTYNGFDAGGIKPAPLGTRKVLEFLLEPKDIVISRSNTPERVGLAGIYNGVPRNCSYPDLMMRIRCKSKLNPKYLLSQILSKYGRKYFIDSAQGSSSSMVKIDKHVVNSFPLPLPPTKAEQEAIAEALSDADALIESIEQVIAKKRLIKQGAMQELLTGKRRLPGFGEGVGYRQTEVGVIPEDWKVEYLDNLVSLPIQNGFSPMCSDAPTGLWTLSLSALTYDGFNKNGIKPAPLGVRKVLDFLLEPKDIIISRSNTPERVGLAGIYNGVPSDCSYPDLMMRIRCKAELNPTYLLSQILSKYGRKYFTDSAQGSSSSMVKIDKHVVNSFPIPLPPTKAEQEAIAHVLTDMDDELDALQEQLDKARQLKQGMMHELLTGRIRLV